ncbi:MAG: hypothetical protein M1609_02375 [Firmicutes bacterium]|nr:hypothetical protein [Bacillota bacterium]
MSFETYTPSLGRKVRVGPRIESVEIPEPSPVITYRMSPEEIAEKYGLPAKTDEKPPIHLATGKKEAKEMKNKRLQKIENNQSGGEIITTPEQVEQQQEVEQKDMTRLVNWLNMPEQEPQERGIYEVFGQTVGRLVDEKQRAYGQAFQKIGQISKILYPSGVPVEKLDDFALVVRVLDKLCRIADGDKTAFGESPWRDVAGYGLLGYVESKEGHCRG